MKKTSNAELRTSNVERRLSLACQTVVSRRLVLVLVLVLDGFTSNARAQSSAALAAATQPLRDGVPQVAVVRLRALLAAAAPDEDRRAAMLSLGEALVATDEPEEAARILDEPVVRDLPAAIFFRAQALAKLTRWSEALPLYQRTLADTKSPYRAEAMYGQAEALRSLRRRDEAIVVFRALERDRTWTTRARLRAVELFIEKQDPKSAARLLAAVQPRSAAERKERRLLRGRIAAAENKPEEAINLFRSILRRPEGATHAVLVATLFAIAEAHLQLNSPGAGANYIEDFIERHPADPDLPKLFAKIDQLYAVEQKQSRHELGRWSRDLMQPRRALAQWYLARAERRMGRNDVALQIFERLHANHPPFAPLAEAFLEGAQLALEARQFSSADASLQAAKTLGAGPEILERIELLQGNSHHKAGRFEEAAESFWRIAQDSAMGRNAATFNASLAWLQAGNVERATAASEELKKRGVPEADRGNLLLEQGLVQAARGAPEAAKSLQDFLRDFPKHERAAEAWVALAELAFHASPTRLDEARQHLARLGETPATPFASERADYLMIWLAESAPARDEQKVITLAEQFVQKHPASPLLPDVRLKLAETYYARQDFASAQTQFEVLAQRNANSPLAEKALFFAAQSAWQSMGQGSLERALVLFDDVVKKNGELKWAARNEQAMIERKLGQPQDALTFYEEVLRGAAAETEKREALCGKADIFYELGATDPENYKRALDFYEQLAGQQALPAHWRNQALFKKGMCLEKMKLPAEALAAFYRIIEDDAQPGKQREYFWYYKAGFNAARLLEEQSKWQPAAAVYEKLAFAGGGRSEEAKSRLNRLRLEHFLWEQ